MLVKCSECFRILTNNEIHFYDNICESCETNASNQLKLDKPKKCGCSPDCEIDKFSKQSQINKWDKYYFDFALVASSMSKDPSCKVGAVIVGPDKEIRTTGFNGFPRGIDDHEDRLKNRDTKLNLVVHAEINAIMNAARIGVSTKGCKMYVICHDATGFIWSGAPCNRCTVEIIQAGITEIIVLPNSKTPERWKESVQLSRELLNEAGISIREVDYE